jgi:rubrerythrin
MKPIRTAPELYACAVCIEREAAERYREFAERMGDHGKDEVAEIFARLAVIEGEHLEALREKSRGMALPPVAPQAYRWIEAGAPDDAARELVLRLMTPRQALTIALGAELRAEAFFEQVFMTAEDPGLRALALEMAEEELEHVVAIERLIEGLREPPLDWQEGAETLAGR